MILILTEKDDVSAMKVCEWLINMEAPFIHFDIEQIKSTFISCNYANGQWQFILKDNYIEYEIDLGEINVIWYRRGYLSINPLQWLDEINLPLHIISAVKKNLQAEHNDLMGFIYSKLKAICINTPFYYNINKLQALTLAKDVGFCVPDTLITTQKSELKAFVAKHKKVISKSISNYLHIKSKDYNNAQSIQVLEEKEVNNLCSNFYYSLFQNYIEKKYELRVFFFMDQIYTLANFSQSNKHSEIDSRNIVNEQGKLNRFSVFELPDDISERIREFMLKAKLNSGSIDIIVTPNMEYYFLEVNPVGQFNYISVFGNFGIEKFIAQTLKNINETILN